jgi:hypothetical protein
MRATRLKSGAERTVRLELAKGVLCILTLEQYVEGLNKGKAERRAARRAQHAQRTMGREDARRLDWIT